MASSSQSRGRGPGSGVYLSFYGPDLGPTFLSCLRGSLSEEGIRCCLDFDTVFHMGQDDASLPSKIFHKRADAASSRFKDIKVAVAIFSENYASFRWCLNELRKIMEHSKHGKLVVLPVFYRVDPTDVRTLSKSFAQALVVHENKFGKDSAKVKRWREALSEAGSLSGCCFNDLGGEAELIRSIIERVGHLLGLELLEVPRNREDKPSPSSMASSSQSQGQAGSSQVYVSFSRNDVSNNFRNRLKRIMTDFDHNKHNHSNMEAIEDSRIAIIIFSKSYAYSSWCKKELAKIMECENHGKLIVRLVFYNMDPNEPLRMAPSYLAGILDTDTGTVKRWIGVLPDEGELSRWHLDDDSDDSKFTRRTLKYVEAMLSDKPLYYFPEGDVTVELQSYNPPRLNEVPSLQLDDDRWSYDVFLSFRGPDSRHTVVSHLYRALRQKGIRTFKDSPGLEAGQRRSELFEALENSRIAIIMFSENYARSKWCLEELNLIMKRKEHGNLSVVPIFYRVSPEEVRLRKKVNGEKGCYQIAMEEMEAKYGTVNPEMVESWKEALWKAGDLIGFLLTEGKDEGNCVDEVMEKVLKLLNRVPLEVAQCPIGINARLKEVKPLLKLDPHLRKVFMLGIYGPGGVGKTTLSKEICNDIMRKFDDWCFLSEVRETPLIELQKRLLCKLLCQKDLEIQNVDEGKTMIRRRLRNKRVLVILDDVDKPDQLDALAGGIDWFGEGSRIIITTRDSHVLNLKGVECKYEVKLLDDAEAGDLFRYHSSRGRLENLQTDLSLINRFLVYANGLPLALVVLGRSLCNRCTSDWESLLEKLEQNPPQDIISILKISFDGLDQEGQEIFLDIACFFKGWDRDYVVKVLTCHGFDPTIVINILVERCLVTIEGGKFQMHGLLETMGKSIARGKCSKDDEIPNRIWLYDDFFDILSKNMGEERCAMKGILLNSATEDQEPISPSTFEDFKRLRLLIVRNVLATEESLCFPNVLRWFEWPKYSAPAIDFSASRKLVGIDLRWSDITQILGKDFKELKYLNLYNCKSLEALPNLSKSSHLMDLNLTKCEKLSRLDDSIGSLDKLVHLNLQDCCNVTEVPSLLRSKHFRTINFSCCSKLGRLPAIKEELLFLKELNLEKTAVKELPDSISNLVAVKILNLSLCKELSVIPGSIFKLKALEQLLASGCPKLETFPRRIGRDSADDHGFPNLVILNLQYCNLKEVEFLRDVTCFKTIKEVYLSGNAFEHVPECISEFKSLEQLWLSYCKNLVELPEVPSSVELHIMGCRNLRSLSSLDAVIHGSQISFQADLSNCHSLDWHGIDMSLSLEEIHERGSSAEVIVARKDFPRWMDFQITDCYTSYKMPLPDGISELDILGLAVSVTFRVMRGGAGSMSERDFSPELSLVVGQHIKFPRSDIDQFDGAHTWFVYIPRRPHSKHDLDYNAKINWRNISLRFEARWARLEICGVRVVCKNELDDQKFMVQKTAARMDYEYETESDYESDNESGQVFNPFRRRPLRRRTLL